MHIYTCEERGVNFESISDVFDVRGPIINIIIISYHIEYNVPVRREVLTLRASAISLMFVGPISLPSRSSTSSVLLHASARAICLGPCMCVCARACVCVSVCVCARGASGSGFRV